MQLAIDQKDIDKFLMVGDKVLIKPKNPQSQTKSGLYLPPTVQQEYGKRRKRERCITSHYKHMKAIWLSFCRMRPTRLILMKRSS